MGLARAFSVDEDDDAIPLVETYRGVGIEDQQPPERIELVKREIDRVHRMSGTVELAGLRRRRWAPAGGENACRRPRRSLVGACGRRAAPSTDISLELLRAATAGLGCRRWRDPDRYASLLDEPGGAEREVPLDDE